MPFSGTTAHSEDYWRRHYFFFLKPIIEKAGYDACRSEPMRADIATQIITNLTKADVVLANLTDFNPNVLWELGIRQSFKNGTITIAQKDTPIPFHFSHKGMLFYNAEHLENQEFESQLQKSLRDCIKNNNEADSPVLEVLGGRSTLYSIINKEENKRKLSVVEYELENNIMFLKQIIDRCEQNEKLRAENKDGAAMKSGNFIFSAVENLYINRYLDIDVSFYKDIRGYLAYTQMFNKYLEHWVDRVEYYEEQMCAKKKGFSIISNSIKTAIKEYKLKEII
jgi:hypothetical protein